MAWANVDTQLQAMLEAVSVSTLEGGLRNGFRYVSEASEDAPPGSRDCTFVVDSGSRSGPNIQQRRYYADTSVLVFYDDMTDAGLLNRIIVSDYEDISDYLLTPSNWNRPTSTIESVALFGGDVIMEYAIERVEGGAILAIRFPILYTRS